jgi:hypothetical protein
MLIRDLGFPEIECRDIASYCGRAKGVEIETLARRDFNKHVLQSPNHMKSCS